MLRLAVNNERPITAAEALEHAARTRWAGLRSEKRSVSQARHALASLAAQNAITQGASPHPAGALENLVVARVGRFTFTLERGLTLPTTVPVDYSGLTLAEITPERVASAVAQWDAAGLTPATIRCRLACLSVIGVDVRGCGVRARRQLKWWLRPEDEERLIGWLTASGDPRKVLVAQLIKWTTRTGLRIEETLRLTWSNMDERVSSCTVPGTKTLGSQATIPLSEDARGVLLWRWDTLAPEEARTPSTRVFPITYRVLNYAWRECRAHIGAGETHGATLKALRRSAARYLHATKGMPLDMLRQYLRHGSVNTTLTYLTLTGGYGTEELRRWL